MLGSVRWYPVDETGWPLPPAARSSSVRTLTPAIMPEVVVSEEISSSRVAEIHYPVIILALFNCKQRSEL